MSFLKNLFGGPKVSAAPPAHTGGVEHLVRVHIPLSGSDMGSTEEFDRFTSLEEPVEQAIQEAGAGYLDGNEFGGGEYTMWLYGPDAARLAEIVKHTLVKHPLPQGAKLFLRHGDVQDASALEETLPLN